MGISINWREQWNIKVRESSLAQAKHLVIKSLIALILKDRYRKYSCHNLIYTEYPTVNGRISDLLHINNKSKEAYIYEVQDNLTKQWQENTIKAYEDYEIPGMNSCNLIIIDVNKLPDNIDDLINKLKEIVI